MTTEPVTPVPSTLASRLSIAEAGITDVKAAVGAGIRDTIADPGLSLFFGFVFAALGAVLIGGLLLLEQIWITIAVGIGFPLVAPFLATGLYEMSRRRSRGIPYRVRDIFLVIFNQRGTQLSWMSFVMLFVFWMWAYQVRIVLALTVAYSGYTSFEDLLISIVTTPDGMTFLAVGTVIGAVLSTILFSITVISMPLLLDKEIDIISAMITSVRTVLASPVVMIGWGATIGALTLFAVATCLAGVIFIFPVLGHATWHLYERLISEREPEEGVSPG